MNTTITKDQMILHDGEVYLIGNQLIPEWYFDGDLLRHNFVDDKDYWQKRPDYKRITHSTKLLDGVIHLNREWFVRGEDIQKEAFDFSETSGIPWIYEKVIVGAWKAGYNANKGEFTREQMEKAFRSGWANSESINSSFELEDSFQLFLNSLQPLSLPNSITLNKDNEIVKIEW